MTCIYLINIVMISQKILCNGIREMFVLQSQVSKRIVPLSCMEKVETLVKVSFLIKINCMETDAYFIVKSPDIKLINQTVGSSAYFASFFFRHS